MGIGKTYQAVFDKSAHSGVFKDFFDTFSPKFDIFLKWNIFFFILKWFKIEQIINLAEWHFTLWAKNIKLWPKNVFVQNWISF